MLIYVILTSILLVLFAKKRLSPASDSLYYFIYIILIQIAFLPGFLNACVNPFFVDDPDSFRRNL